MEKHHPPTNREPQGLFACFLRAKTINQEEDMKGAKPAIVRFSGIEDKMEPENRKQIAG